MLKVWEFFSGNHFNGDGMAFSGDGKAFSGKHIRGDMLPLKPLAETFVMFSGDKESPLKVKFLVG